MYKYLIADYIVGYCLSCEDHFSTDEIAAELFAAEIEVQKIFNQLLTLHPNWFERSVHNTGSKLIFKRNKQYDKEMVLWLKTGASANFFGEEKLAGNVEAKETKSKHRSTLQKKLGRILQTIFPKRR